MRGCISLKIPVKLNNVANRYFDNVAEIIHCSDDAATAIDVTKDVWAHLHPEAQAFHLILLLSKLPEGRRATPLEKFTCDSIRAIPCRRP